MFRRYSLPDPPPADAQAIGNLKIKRENVQRYDQTIMYCVKIWSRKQSKPYANYSFKTEDSRNEYIAKQIENDQNVTRIRAENKASDKLIIAEMMEKIQVGTILHYSWGYDQTQCEYYQVVSKRGRKITIREIGSKTVPGSEGFMCDMRTPCRDKFIGDPINKIINGSSISMPHGCATICSETDKHYCSWYA